MSLVFSVINLHNQYSLWSHSSVEMKEKEFKTNNNNVASLQQPSTRKQSTRKQIYLVGVPQLDSYQQARKETAVD